MLLHYVGSLPDRDEIYADTWSRWQAYAIRLFVTEAVGLPFFGMKISGCEGDKVDDWPTGPEDHVHPDALGIFYNDGDEEYIEHWDVVCTEALSKISEAFDWQHIRPSDVGHRAKRMGLDIRPTWDDPPEVSTGISMSPEEIDAMERKKNDDCDVYLGRQCYSDSIISGRFETTLLESYVELMTGPMPSGVQLKYLWQPSKTQRWKRTGQPVKIHVGWGLNHEHDHREQARSDAELWRLAYCTFVGSADLERLDLERLRDVYDELGMDSLF